jgi:hypothetical protein
MVDQNHAAHLSARALKVTVVLDPGELAFLAMTIEEQPPHALKTQ